MQVYVKRAYQGRLKSEADRMGEQYSPEHTNSTVITDTTGDSESYTGGYTDAAGLAEKNVTVPDGMTVTFSKTNTTFNRTEKVGAYIE